MARLCPQRLTLSAFRRLPQCRNMAVYAMGDGWTGALGTGSLDDYVPGHSDDQEYDLTDASPALVYKGAVKSVATGWGHSAIVTDKGKLLVCGRPHDFSTLLRLKRMPVVMRNYAVRHSVRYNETGEEPDTLSGKVISWMLGEEDGPDGPWRDARRNSILPGYVPIDIPGDAKANSVVASAGLTAVLSDEGKLYTFGLNHHGQCGIGKMSNNVWTPKPVVGLSTKFADKGRANIEQEHPIAAVAVGLQHGLALDTQGNLFVWGKGARGQLGIEEEQSLEYAHPVRKFRLASQDGRQNWASGVRVRHISAGMNHSAAVTEDNLVFVWGKNVAEPKAQEDFGKPVVDAPAPVFVAGLPDGIPVRDIACGSHHTAVLLEDGSVWAIGIATDNRQPILEAVKVIFPGVVDTPCSFFGADFDRTTIVGKNGSQVLQVHLWSDEELRKQAIFAPAWVDYFEDKVVQSVHRGWLHTLVVTKD